MHISEFSEQDLLVTVHGYPRYDDGRTRDATRRLVTAFPGRCYGVAERGHEEDLYGASEIPSENIFRTEPGKGWFMGEQLPIDDPDYLVLPGGYIGACHRAGYDSLPHDRLPSDTEVILPPRRCFGHMKTAHPDISTYTLQDFRTGTLPAIEDQGYVREKLSQTVPRLDSYNWEKTAIRPIDVSSRPPHPF